MTYMPAETQPEEELLCDIHNINIDDNSLRMARIELELRDFNEDALEQLLLNLRKIKLAALRARRRIKK